MKHFQAASILCAASIVGIAPHAQLYEPSPLHLRVEGADIVFEADVCLETRADGATTLVGIPRMKVEMTYSRWVVDHYEDYDLVQETDADGHIRIPAGMQPLFGD